MAQRALGKRTAALRALLAPLTGNRQIWAWVFAAWLGFLIWHTSTSTGGGSQLFWNWDKVKHFGYFAGGGYAFTLALASRSRLWLTLAVLSLVGAGHEVWQIFIPERQQSAADLLADTLGAALGYWFAKNPKSPCSHL